MGAVEATPHLTPQMEEKMLLAKTLYDAVASVIDKACESKGFREVCDVAAQLGMAGGELNSFNALRYEFAYADEVGDQVTLNVRSYDPSGPFQNEPEINRFTVKLISRGREVASHERQYNE